jgi:hypothetical protein
MMPMRRGERSGERPHVLYEYTTIRLYGTVRSLSRASRERQDMQDGFQVPRVGLPADCTYSNSSGCRARIMKDKIILVLAYIFLVSIPLLEGAYGFHGGSFGIRVTHRHERISSSTTALSMGLVKSAVRIRDSMLSKDRR